MEKLKLKEIQKETLRLLLIFDQICKSIGVQYTLIWGSLIGAVRHKGFIPWDDDLDVLVKRDDFEKLMNYFENNNISPYKIASRKNTNNYVYGIPRFFNSNFIYKSTIPGEKKIELGIFIDIYPLDNYGDSISVVNKVYKKMHKLKRNYYIYVGNFYAEKGIKKFLFILKHKYFKIRYGNTFFDKIEREQKKILSEYTSSKDKYVGVAVWDANTRPYFFDRRMFEDFTYLEFEHHYFPAPKMYDKILKETYGDYLQLPPVESRKPQHNYEIYRK